MASIGLHLLRTRLAPSLLNPVSIGDTLPEKTV